MKEPKRNETMTEYKIGAAIVRIYGKPDQENIKAATARFLKKVEKQRRSKRKNENAQTVRQMVC
jgi:CRISPR/Cas system Type II protein with McrA/HNH and RuvC-like nuclease domain